MYRQDVLTLPLAPSVRQKLKAAGFNTVVDVSRVGPVDLAAGTVAQLAHFRLTAETQLRLLCALCSCQDHPRGGTLCAAGLQAQLHSWSFARHGQLCSLNVAPQLIRGRLGWAELGLL